VFLYTDISAMHIVGYNALVAIGTLLPLVALETAMN